MSKDPEPVNEWTSDALKWWDSIEIPVDDVVRIRREFLEKAPPLDGRDCLLLTILTIECRLVRPQMASVPELGEDAPTVLRSVAEIVRMSPGLFPSGMPAAEACDVLHEEFKSWLDALGALGEKPERELSRREFMLIENYREEMVPSHIRVDTLAGDIHWCLASAIKRRKRRAAEPDELGASEQTSAFAAVYALIARGETPFRYDGKGRYRLNQRKVRDELAKLLPPDDMAAPGPEAESVAEDGLRRFLVERCLVDLFRKHRSDPAVIAVFGYWRAQEELPGEIELPGVPPEGYSTVSAAAEAHDLTKKAVEHGFRRMRAEMRRMLWA